MSPVQAAVLPLLPELTRPYDTEKPSSSPRDLLVKARTGTGKTLGFLIPAVEARLKALEEHARKATRDSGLKPNQNVGQSSFRNFARRHTGVVIISPTRELATQIANEARKLVKYLDLEVHLFVGGESKGAQLREFRRGAHDIIVATPGRMNDILDSAQEVADSVAHTQTVRILVFICGFPRTYILCSAYS
jgi:ATP-dependent RNA helicase MSS116